MKDIQIKDKVKISFPTVFGTITHEGEGIKKYTDKDGWRFCVKYNDILLDISIPLLRVAAHRDSQNAIAPKQAEDRGATSDRYVVKDLTVQELTITGNDCCVVLWWTDCYGTHRIYNIHAKIIQGYTMHYLQINLPEFYF